MSIEMPTPEEMAKIYKNRTLSDAELINEGAEYVVNKNGVKLEATYAQVEDAKKEMNEQISIIKRPKNPDVISELKNKLEEYKQRLAKIMEKIGANYKSNEQTFMHPGFIDARYKIAVLKNILDEGQVNTYELAEELRIKDGQFDSRAFNNACGVIADRCETGGKNLRSGTGL